MSEERRKNICPKCGHDFLYMLEDRVTCAGQGCDWQTKSKRQEDSNLPKGVEK